ncbi:MAG: ArsA family ATPase [Proteobacteria bacterium]|nr:ArsA family ATPase [Pseudomonadota bacterium]
MTALLDKDFIVVAGKGGVGRTTVSMVLGRIASSRGKRTLVCLGNAPSRYCDLLGDVVLDATIRKVSKFLDVVNLEPRASQEEYGLKVLHNHTLHRLIFGSQIVRGFLDAVPGLAEWAMLGKATFHALNIVDGRPEYDIVVFDSPATGHGLDLLALPRAIASAVPAGRMHEEALARLELMEDPSRSEVIPVTIPEEMPVNEAGEFVSGLSELGLIVERITINMVTQSAIRPELASLLNRIWTQPEPPPSWLLPTAAALGRQRVQVESIERLRTAVPANQIILPLIPGGSLDEASLLVLAEAFAKGMN